MSAEEEDKEMAAERFEKDVDRCLENDEKREEWKKVVKETKTHTGL